LLKKKEGQKESGRTVEPKKLSKSRKTQYSCEEGCKLGKGSGARGMKIGGTREEKLGS